MHANRSTRPLGWVVALLATTLLAAPAWAGGKHATYEVEITNVTKGQSFTPQLVVTHSSQVALFTPGSPASSALELLAEAGDTGPLTEQLAEAGDAVGEAVTIPGLLGPGQTATVQVKARRWHSRISLAAMLVPTNDTFVSLVGERLPSYGSRTYEAQAWDAGTEENDQSCRNVPGPRCGGAGHSPGPADGDEGFVHVSNGFHDLGDEDEEGFEVLGPFTYDWSNPVARITVRRVD